MMMTAAFIVCVILLLASVAFNLKQGLTIVEFEETVVEALDVCDGAYALIASISEMPVADDSQEVRHVVRSVQNVRDAILRVSNVLAGPGGVDES